MSLPTRTSEHNADDHRIMNVDALASSVRKSRAILEGWHDQKNFDHQQLRTVLDKTAKDYHIAIRKSVKTAQRECLYATDAIASWEGLMPGGNPPLAIIDVARSAHQCSQAMNKQFKLVRTELLRLKEQYLSSHKDNVSSDADAHSEQDRLPVIPSAEDLNDLIQYITYFVDWWADIDTSLANVETTLNGSSRSRTRVTERWAKVQGKCASFHQQINEVILPTDCLPPPKIYKHLVTSLGEELSAQEPTLQILSYSDTLRGYVEQMGVMDNVGSLAQSDDYRKMLMDLSRTLECNENSIRNALNEDDAYIVQTLHDVLCNDADQKAVLQLQDTDAKCFLTLTCNAIDKKMFPLDVEGSRSRQDAHRLLVKLSKKCGILPASLAITGIKDYSQNPVAGGHFADILPASYQGEDVVLKRLREYNVPQQRELIHKKFCAEAVIWQGLKHKNILPFYGVDMVTFFPRLCMVSPWMPRGNIMKHLRDVGGPSYIPVTKYLLEIAEGLQFLHSHGVIHGDIRGANILIDKEWNVRLADFGLAGFADTTLTAPGLNGTVRWMAPELLEHEVSSRKRTKASDIYAFACVGLQIYTMQNPFSEIESYITVSRKVIDGQRPRRPTEITDSTLAMSDDLWNLVENCWRQADSSRPDIDHVVEKMKAIHTRDVGSKN